ncbi:MAG TPA: glycosyltransferase family 4 protein, partial [Azonexus sp.]|nr:glycosyltransferase family 4 protein [Azonexus sp.]
MKLLYAFPEPLPLPKARGVQVAWMVDALCRAGVALTLAYVPSASGHPLSPIGRTVPANLQLLPLSRNWPFPFQRWHSVERFSRLLLREIDRIRPDAIFVRHFKLAARLLQARPDIPLIFEAHEIFADTVSAGKRQKIAEIESRVLGFASGVVYISGAVRAALRERYVVRGQEIILHSGVELPAFVPAKPWNECARHIVYAGSFYDWKGVDDLVRAAADLPGCRMTLLGGDAADIERLRPLVSSTGAELVFLPRMAPEAVMAYLLEACIAVLPNRADGVSRFTSPLKLFEYMGAGCAIVAADLPSIREVLPATLPGWFSPGDSVSLSAVLRAMVQDPVRLK